MLRNAYARYRQCARHTGFKGSFKELCVSVKGSVPVSPKEWVEAAYIAASWTIQNEVL
jgi:hypothetical protein